MEPEQVQNIMDSMIKKLYDMELEELGRSGWQDEKLLSEVRKLLENNKASIQVEDKTGREDVDLAFAIADYVVVMFDGEVFAEGTVDEIRKNEAVQKIYLGEAAAT